MKKLLPVLFPFFILFFLFFPQAKVYAQAQTPITIEGQWEENSDVTFVGKMAARANDFINWSLKDYKWISVEENKNNPLISFWAILRNIVYAFLALFILVTAFLMIINRGQNITIMKFLPKFGLIVVFITFSFAIIQILYQITDIIQGFFLKTGNEIISSKHLLSVAFGYADFSGFRRLGDTFDESVFISLLLTKATAITYFIMGGILMVRKIILWFFLIISPILPLLFFYYPIRNTAKIWIGEFFRWLLYAPIFAILLSGLVSLWKSDVNIPLNFNKFSSPSSYPTAINILIGGPGQTVSFTNSLNNPETFAQYVVALLMLWVVMLLPFILLHIFLDYLFSLSVNNPGINQLLGKGASFFGRSPVPPIIPPANHPIVPSPVLPSQSTGLARSLPFAKQSFKSFDYSKQSQFSNTQVSNIRSIQTTSEILRTADISVPTMRDIAKYETNMLSTDTTKKAEVTRMNESLQRIANPTLISTPIEREKFTQIKTHLSAEQQKGNPLAFSVLSAASSLEQGGTKSGTVGYELLSVEKQKGNPLAFVHQKEANLPVINKVQTVSFDDYEAVKKLWQENYHNLEVPKILGEKEKSREEWIKVDMGKITETINLLSSGNPQKVSEGMKNVSKILPFLLIGGFSQTEVIAYLKAKLEAGKNVVSDLEKKQEEEDTTILTSEKQEEKPKEMMAEIKLEENQNSEEIKPDQTREN
ncbi:hypothetical protein C4559_06110 [Candidatus Microgenomates bacterium]|nr:MAG: hypothetical protein C4559_06110 [Candidatus Microgenomates bacterium]